jgi:hypothetical protein
MLFTPFVRARTFFGRLSLEERKQIRVDLVFMRRAQAVRRALVDVERRVLNDLGREQGRVAYRHDLIVVSMQDQGRNVECFRSLNDTSSSAVV